MTTAFIIINALITITALILCIRAWIGLRAVSKTQRRTVGELSPLERRKKALELATKAWLYSVEHGLTFGESHERKVMERLEREVAELENERFGPKEGEHVAPKVETPKRKHVTTVSGRYHEVWGRLYRARCSACGWSWDSYLVKTAEEEGAKHERRNA